MRERDGLIISSCVLSLLFSILTLTAGSKKGVLNSVAIVTYTYQENLISNSDIDTWFFEVHYLSLCAGYLVEDENASYTHLNCSYRLGSYKFRTNDPFILNYQAINGEYPVEPGSPDEMFDLRPPFACLVLGICFTVLSLVVVICEMLGLGWWGDLGLVGVGFTMLASIFLMVSSALVTSIIMRSYYDKQDYKGWTTSFLGLTWPGVAFMYCAFVVKALDVIVTKEKRRRLLRTGQI